MTESYIGSCSKAQYTYVNIWQVPERDKGKFALYLNTSYSANCALIEKGAWELSRRCEQRFERLCYRTKQAAVERLDKIQDVLYETNTWRKTLMGGIIIPRPD
ncbi:hypothetical protein CGCF415_v010100 [Colletotrichum fructicola]|nr:hypothetical protein CGCFRS4_v003743 [Colletotrichum fructicola]KAF4900358.1 hypothetical protein CGCF415_v010100 [Colletotrichum fructicola]KAF4924597.1 hypothetical protein CGCF245_v014431 [Colletotrichum fructicola]